MVYAGKVCNPLCWLSQHLAFDRPKIDNLQERKLLRWHVNKRRYFRWLQARGLTIPNRFQYERSDHGNSGFN